MMGVRSLAVLTLSTMLLAACAPGAFAQAALEGDDSVRPVDCSQVQAVLANQNQYGDAAGGAGSGTTAEVAQKLNITQGQVNSCLGNPNRPAERPEEGPPGDEDEVLSDTDPGGTLPETGGPGVLAPLLGLALVAGGAALLRAGRR